MLSKQIYALVFLMGAVAFLYPLVSNMVNRQAQTHAITRYEEEVAACGLAQIEGLRNDAQSYNRFVAGLEGNVTDGLTEEEQSTTDVVYMSVLSTGEAIGYVKIPKIDVELPIYRGTSDAVLSRGVGHLERSSLPVGGTDTHTVLVGHRGLPTSRLFRDLGLLQVGDVFLVNSLGTTLAYEVESITTVLPSDVSSLQVQEGRDLCTLVTCDPYMVNSHRLLVTGHRVDYAPSFETAAAEQGHFFQRYWEYFMVIGAFMLLVAALALLRWRIKRQAFPGGRG